MVPIEYLIANVEEFNLGEANYERKKQNHFPVDDPLGKDSILVNDILDDVWSKFSLHCVVQTVQLFLTSLISFKDFHVVVMKLSVKLRYFFRG